MVRKNGLPFKSGQTKNTDIIFNLVFFHPLHSQDGALDGATLRISFVLACTTLSKFLTIFQPAPSVQCFNGTYEGIKNTLSTKLMLQHTTGKRKNCKEKRLRFYLGDAKELQQNLHGRILSHWPLELD